MLELNIIVCVDTSRGISKLNQIPWKFTEDTRYFKDIVGHKFNNKPNLIVSGRKTFEHMGVFKNHMNLIISSNFDISKYSDDHVYTVENLERSIEFMKEHRHEYSKIYICGGRQVYADFFDLVLKHQDKYHGVFYVTAIKGDFKCDSHLPNQFKDVITARHQMFNFTHDNRDGVELVCQNHVDGKYYNLVFMKPFNIHNELISTHNPQEQAYLTLMSHLLKSHEKIGRNGATLSDFGAQLKFKLDKFPLLTSKKVYFKGVFEELMFFIRGQTDSKILSEKNVKIWEGNTSKEFLASNNLNYQVGDMGPMYGYQWRHFGQHYHGCNKEYHGGVDQLKYVLNELKTNPSSRRIIMSTYNPAQVNEGVLFPCHGIGIVFNTRELEISQDEQEEGRRVFELSCMQLQRSCDYFLGVPFNIASYALLVYLICEVLNNDESCCYEYRPGNLIMSLGDYHLYYNHIAEARRQLVRTPVEFPTLRFKNKKFNIEDFELEDIELVNYNPHLEIKAEMVC